MEGVDKRREVTGWVLFMDNGKIKSFWTRRRKEEMMGWFEFWVGGKFRGQGEFPLSQAAPTQFQGSRDSSSGTQN